MRIEVRGRRWFDGANGNTYHSGTVTVDGEETPIPFQYGYGDQYLESAHEELAKLCILPQETYGNGVPKGMRRTCEELGAELSYAVGDVTRRRDL